MNRKTSKTPAPSCGAAEGQRRKELALDILEARRELLMLSARRAFIIRLIAFGQATIDDVRAVVETPTGTDPKAFGAVPREFARAGIVRRDGMRPSKRPEAHARPVTIWKLIDRPAAEEWLARHPAPVEPRQSSDGASKSQRGPS